MPRLPLVDKQPYLWRHCFIRLSIIALGCITFATNTLFSIRLQLGFARLMESNDHPDHPGTTSIGTSATSNRTVEFINWRDDLGPTRKGAEMYSGMWWQNKQDFLQGRFHEISGTDNAAATFLAFHVHGRKEETNPGYKGVLMTRDWLDMNVEHLSKYIRLLQMATVTTTTGNSSQQNALMDGIVKILNRYINNSQQYGSPNQMAVHSTIALVPFKTVSNPNQNQLLMLQLATTLASLWKVGIARTLVVGMSELERNTFLAIKDLLEERLNIDQTMELVYIQKDKVTKAESKLIPKLALTSLQRIMEQQISSIRKQNTSSSDKAKEEEEVEAWLGQDPARWKFVYFTEPDLLLHIRASALPAITQQLEQGKLMAAHRLEPLPHMRDFDDDVLTTNKLTFRNPEHTIDSFLLPNHGVFSSLQTLDAVGDDDVCCDQGVYYPAHRKDPTIQERTRMTCGTMWHMCGYGRKDTTGKDYKNQTVLLDVHHRLIGYPFFSLQTGTGLPLVGSHQRVCIPKKGPTENCAAVH